MVRLNRCTWSLGRRDVIATWRYLVGPNDTLRDSRQNDLKTWTRVVQALARAGRRLVSRAVVMITLNGPTRVALLLARKYGRIVSRTSVIITSKTLTPLSSINTRGGAKGFPPLLCHFEDLARNFKPDAVSASHLHRSRLPGRISTPIEVKTVPLLFFKVFIHF